ncbi:uncharacterized protein LTR77_007206 [Saxophila tyrrhenica]|uniref:Translation initiation factor 3 N-terminal domain-containing protein n=1 Tax=Saxophila tyrrhenica TaxID=1690608 RepID=A0AAV9P7V3_9PEZI|nr:hypothetical protein LTR77_007206 [Saxophila tyrrhenica]
MHTKHLASPAQALFRVFVQPALSHRAPPTAVIQQSFKGAQRIRQQPSACSRPLSTTTARLAKTRAPSVRKELWDEEITGRLVYLVNQETGKIFDPETGRPPEPVRREELMRNMDRKTHRLVQVAPGLDIGAREGGGGQQREEQATYRPEVVSKKAAYEAASKRKEQMKEKRKISNVASSVKTLELNWAIDSNDLGHRMERMQEFLGEGRKVEVVLAAKKKGRKASMEECAAALARIRKAVDDVDGAKEVGTMEGKMGGFAVLKFQGRMPAVNAKEA